jgi:hypothetical protein
MLLIASGTMQTDDAQQFYHADLSAEGRRYVPPCWDLHLSHMSSPWISRGLKMVFGNATSIRYSHASTRDGALK